MSTRTVVQHWAEAVHSHNAADAIEDCAQAEFLRTRSTEHLDRWILALGQTMTADRALLASLIWERRVRDGEVRP